MSQSVATLIEDLTDDMDIYLVTIKMGIRGTTESCTEVEAFLAFDISGALDAATILANAMFIKDDGYDYFDIVEIKKINQGPIWVKTYAEDWDGWADEMIDKYIANRTPR